MSLIKLAIEEQKTGVTGFSQRHPILTAGIALTGGLAAADAGLASFNRLKEVGGGTLKAGIKQFRNNTYARNQVLGAAKHGLGQGALYGSILSTAEPAIAHMVFKKPVDKNG